MNSCTYPPTWYVFSWMCCLFLYSCYPPDRLTGCWELRGAGVYVYRSLVACVVRLSIAALLRNLMWSAHRITWYIIHKCFTAQSWDTNEGAKKEKEKSLFLFLSGDAGCGSGKGVCEGGEHPFCIHTCFSFSYLSLFHLRVRAFLGTYRFLPPARASEWFPFPSNDALACKGYK